MKYISTEIRQKYLDFFAWKNHAIIPSAPVVPENDPTVLFNTAGMQPLVPYLLWEKHPSGNRIADSQKCIRTGDIEEVWDNSHLTFFEMLGNWSLWDYFKKESLAYSYEFLTWADHLALDPKKIAVTVFEWDHDAPRDEESARIWEDIGIPKDRISYLPASENWWAAGPTWPCGPDSEIFYWVWESEFPPAGSNVENDEDNWMEIWNNVFMEYNRKEDWSLEKLPNQNVDTGMGLERITTVLNGFTSVYHTDIFQDYIKAAERILNLWEDQTDEQGISIRIIVDHIRCAVVMMSDGVIPSNVDQGYVLRKLIRRAIRQWYKISWENREFVWVIASEVIYKLWEAYPNISENASDILFQLQKEERQFLETLEKWLKEFDKLVKWFEIAFERTGKKIDTIAWNKAFKLYDTFGFPLEMTVELAEERWLNVDVEGFNEAEKKHQELSRKWAEQKFKWGLADASEATTELHTATHLLLAGLRKVLWDHVFQKGSNITAERLRFDFSHDEKVSRDDLDKVEEFVNHAITAGTRVSMEEVPKQTAIDRGVVWSFWEKYPDVVKVYTMQSDSEVFSVELCGWPHVEKSEAMWRFKIKKEEASSRGVRRIKAVLIKD